MIKKIVHLADLHLRTMKMHDVFNHVTENLISSLENEIGNYQKDEVRIVIVGDLVHQKITISNEQNLILFYFLKKLTKFGKVVVVLGNHDLLENNSDRIDSISPIIKYLDSEDIIYLPDSGFYVDENIVWCNFSIKDKKIIDINEFKVNNKHLLKNKFISLYHGAITGSKTSIGYKFENDNTTNKFIGSDFVLMGDIHLRQEFILNEVGDFNIFNRKELLENHFSEVGEEMTKQIKIAYCGSFYQNDFGESLNGHGYLLWDVENNDYTEIDLDNDFSFLQIKIGSHLDIEKNIEKLINR